MAGEPIARNYAAALFELAEKEGRTEEYGAALEPLARLLEEVPELRLFLETPRIDRDEKKKVLRETFRERMPQHVLNFVLLVVDKRRQRLLGEIVREYRSLLDVKQGRAHVEVAVARELDDEELAEVKAQLTRILGVEAVPHVRVKPELLGGIVFRSGDMIFDGSVRRRLDSMRRRLMGADVSTDQGRG